MTIEEWVLHAQIAGNFVMTSEEYVKVVRPHPALWRFELTPAFDDSGNQTGLFDIEVALAVEAGESREESGKLIADLGRDLFEDYVNMLTFLSGEAVRVTKQPTLKYRYPGTNKYRQLLFAEKLAELREPVVLGNLSVVAAPLSPAAQKGLFFYRLSLEQRDVLASLMLLMVVVELLANQFEVTEKIVRTCTKCGHETILKAGMRQKVKHLFCAELDYDDLFFDRVWDARIILSHGGYEPSMKRSREMAVLRNELTIAVVKGIKKVLGLAPEDAPDPEAGITNYFIDPVLDVEYTVPE